MSPGPRQAWRLQWRRSTWARSTSSRSRLYGDRRSAQAAAERLLGEGFRITLSVARIGLWHPESLDLPDHTPGQPAGCEACDGTGVLLAEVEPLSRPCPPCRVVAS